MHAAQPLPDMLGQLAAGGAGPGPGGGAEGGSGCARIQSLRYVPGNQGCGGDCVCGHRQRCVASLSRAAGHQRYPVKSWWGWLSTHDEGDLAVGAVGEINEDRRMCELPLVSPPVGITPCQHSVVCKSNRTPNPGRTPNPVENTSKW